MSITPCGIIGRDLMALEAAGFKPVGIAADMVSALRLAEQQAVDLATMDVQLARGGSGVETAVKLWIKDAVPSVFVSASLDPDTPEQAAAAHPVGFIDKSYGADKIVAFVKCHFSNQARHVHL